MSGNVPNQHWPQWILASVVNHFKTRLTDSGLTLFREGEAEYRSIQNRAELRLDGPQITLLSKDFWRLYIEANFLVSTPIGKDIHLQYKNTGLLAAAFTRNISVLRYGDPAEDVIHDESFYGCLVLLQDMRGNQHIEINHFGKIDPAVDLFQSTVEGHFEMFIDTTGG